MRVLITGQVGLEKSQYLAEVKQLLEDDRTNVESLIVGEEMIKAHGGNIEEKTILNLPKGQLDCLRKLAWKSILGAAEAHDNNGIFIVNSHAVFRWHHGLFPAMELDLVLQLDPEIILTVIDDTHVIAENLKERGTSYFDLWELMAWREEEIILTQFLGNSVAELRKKTIPFYLVPKAQGAELLARLLIEPSTPKIYLSFSVTGLPDELKKEVNQFKKSVSREYIVFDPLAMSERSILIRADSLTKEMDAAFRPIFEKVLSDHQNEEDDLWRPLWDNSSALGLTKIRIEDQWIAGGEVNAIRGAIDGQIITRDYHLIDQSDMILMFISTTEGGQPRISAGSQSEMLYAYSQGKPVYGICQGGKRKLSPWVTQFSEVLETLDEALAFIRSKHPVKTDQMEEENDHV